jgi:hypothetical protein
MAYSKKASSLLTATLAGIVLVFLLDSPLLAKGPVAQQKSGRELSAMTDSEVQSYVRTILKAKVPEAQSDELIVLAMNRGAIAIPELLAEITRAYDASDQDDKLIHRLADIVAYASNEHAIGALAQLCSLDTKRFGYFLARSLTYASGRRKSFTLAYLALTKLPKENQYLVIDWVQRNANADDMKMQWADALYERYKAVPTDSDLETDPIASQLPGGVPPDVKARVREIAAQRSKDK